ncbi:MAG TPA: TPM domain-containing protein [Oscillatoriaceae cyanobacterium M33_DOE_052]|uniref:TPM domain-containing protein n=1 Tax=Planktothricoides sp. SpSt-374 TaxID=2282167 RepID=A0A7C3ZVW6_9CYAN|nr:TPM domain-containing protein [Oscillatoriaceae cyanobacterium M33_DOE_052]
MSRLSIKRLLVASILFLCLMWWAPTASARHLFLGVQDIPNPLHQSVKVTDGAQMLLTTTETELNQMISQLEGKTGVKMGVVTISTATPTTPRQLAVELFHYWGMGDNDILLLIAAQERRLEVATGAKLRQRLPEESLGEMLTAAVTPKLARGDNDEGVLAATAAVVDSLGSDLAWFESEAAFGFTHQRAPLGKNLPKLLLWLGLVAGLVAVFWRRRATKSRLIRG